MSRTPDTLRLRIGNQSAFSANPLTLPFDFAVQHGLLEARREVVEHDDLFACLAELSNDMRADIAGAARHQNCLAGHTFKGVT